MMQVNGRGESQAVKLILIAVFAYSALPVLGAYSLDTLNPLVFVAKSFFQYSLLQAIVWSLWSFVFGKKVLSAPEKLPQTRQTYASLALAGILIAASYSCLFTSFYFINKAGASVLYETWPIFVIIGLPLLVRQRFESLSTADLMYVLLAFLGVIFVISGSATDGLTSPPPLVDTTQAVTGYLLAALSGLTMAIAVIIKANLMKKLSLDRGAIPVVALVEGTHRFIGGSALLLLSMTVTNVSMEDLMRIDVSTAFAVMELVGASAFWFAIIATRRSTINVLWYLAPMLAVVWLSLLGLAQVNTPIVVGAVLIIASNILTSRRESAPEAKS